MVIVTKIILHFDLIKGQPQTASIKHAQRLSSPQDEGQIIVHATLVGETSSIPLSIKLAFDLWTQYMIGTFMAWEQGSNYEFNKIVKLLIHVACNYGC